MNKAELIAAVAARSDLPKCTAQKALDAVIGAISDSLAEGNPVAISGFGSFSVTSRKERIGRNPQTGQEVKIPASRAPKFSGGATLKAAVNR